MMDIIAAGLTTKNDEPVPLMGVEARCEITGMAAKVKVIQGFANKEKTHIEAVYKFPLPEGCAVCGFRAVVGDRVIEGGIEERDEAFKMYDQALAEGHGAQLLDEERPNVFTLSLGNIPPGASMTVQIDYVTQLESSKNGVRFFLPTTISPRYIPADMPDWDGIPVDALINPPVALTVPYGLRLEILIHGRNDISAIESPSHTISTRFESDKALVTFSSETVDMDRDFILNLTYVNSFATRAFLHEYLGERFIQLDLNDLLSKTASDSGRLGAAREIVFVLDCSGSMEGNSIAEAKKALEILIKALDPGTRFNLYRFGSTFKKMFPESKPYSDASRNESLGYLAKIKANLGGTEMLAPLKSIYAESLPQGTRRDVILITDGEVGNENEIMDLVRKHRTKTGLFTVGIGHGPNEYLIRGIARAAGGASEFIAPNEKIGPKVLGLFRKVVAGRTDHLNIDWGLSAEQAPSSFVLFPDETTSVFARLPGDGPIPSRVTLSQEDGAGRQEWLVDLSTVTGSEIPIPKLWARERIRELEEAVPEIRGSRQLQKKEQISRKTILDLSRRYGIMSRETSFVSIEKRVDSERITDEIILRKVPVMLTTGWGDVARVPSQLAAMKSPMRPRSAVHDKCMLDIDCMDMPERSIPFRENALGYGYDSQAPERNLMLEVLSLQRTDGGFDAAHAIAGALNMSMDELREIAQRIQTRDEVDRLVLLSTVLALLILERKFQEERQTWSGVVRKSIAWLSKVTARVQPEIDGETLDTWVRKNL